MRMRCAAAVTAVLCLPACTGHSATDGTTTGATGSTTAGSATTRAGSSTSSTSAGSASSATDPRASCVDSLLTTMTPAQRAGQLIMVGLDRSSTAESLDAMIRRQHIGNIFFIGGWRGATKLRQASEHVQSQANTASTRNVKFLVAADQEGGQVQQLRGEGFTPLPSALVQGAMSPADRAGLVTTIGRELKAVGVNVDLAPVADTVPPRNPMSNEPIGRWGRQYANDPDVAGAAVSDVVKALQAVGTQSTLKHFPGLGRITGNTDFTADGIVDDRTSAQDEYLRPFRDGIVAGAPMVMMSSAFYPRMDPTNQAVFSSKIINGVLRGQLGFTGVVVSDDLNAVAVRGIPAGRRVVRMVRAGGDLALTGLASAAPAMATALTQEAAADPAFAAMVDASARRVLTLKTNAGLTACSAH